MKSRLAVVLGVMLALAVLALRLDVTDWLRIRALRAEAEGLTPAELVARCDADNWVFGERIAELGAEAMPAILEALEAPTEESRSRAGTALLWSGEAGARAWVGRIRGAPGDALAFHDAPEVPRVLRRAAESPLPPARPHTSPEAFGRSAARLWTALAELIPGLPADQQTDYVMRMSGLSYVAAAAGAAPDGWQTVLRSPWTTDPVLRVLAPLVLDGLEEVLADDLRVVLREGGDLHGGLIAAEVLTRAETVPSPEAVAVLLRALHDPHEELRTRAATVVRRLEPGPSCDSLVARLVGIVEGREVGYEAAIVALGCHGERARAAVPAMRDMLGHVLFRESVQVEAAAALWRLGEDPATLREPLERIAAREGEYGPVTARKLLKHMKDGAPPPDRETWLAIVTD